MHIQHADQADKPPAKSKSIIDELDLDVKVIGGFERGVSPFSLR